MLYKLSRFSKLHNFLRVIANNILWRIPYAVKYPIGTLVRRYKLPYRVINEGDTVVQLGAPWDLLKAGRSRAITFSRLVGKSGRVIVCEPDARNVEFMQNFIASQNITNISLVPKGAWNKPGTLRFLSDPDHPAANLIEEVYDEQRTDIENYDVTEIPVDSLDNILGGLNADNIKLLSITTNGSELQILEGYTSLRNAEFVSVIGKVEDFKDLPKRGFEYSGGDDRGYFYTRNA